MGSAAAVCGSEGAVLRGARGAGMKKLFLILMLAVAAAALDVDVYQNMLYGVHDSLLIADTANLSSYGAYSADSTALWSVTDSLYVSDSFLVTFPGTINVRSVDKNESPAHTWRWRNKWDNTYATVLWDTNGHASPYNPTHSKVTVGFFYRTDQSGSVTSQHDQSTVGLSPSGWITLQTIGVSGMGNNVYIRAHSQDASGSTYSDTIKISININYWVILHHDADSGKCWVAVYNASTWAQVGISSCASWPGRKTVSRARVGRCDAHGDNPDNATSTWISHYMIDYTNGAFPLLPDTSLSGNIHYASPGGLGDWRNARYESFPCSLGLSNDSADAGDTVYLQSGIYGNYIAPANSGTSAKRIRFISQTNRDAKFNDLQYGALLDGVSYVTVDGIAADTCEYGFTIQNKANYNEILNSAFTNDRDTSNWDGCDIYLNSQHNRIANCLFSRWGYGTRNATFTVGGNGDVDTSYYNAIEACTLFYTGHHAITFFSKYNVARNNVMHNEKGTGADSIQGYRCMMLEGYAPGTDTSGFNLIEGNRIGNAHGTVGLDCRSPHNIIRNNCFFDNGHGGLRVVTDDQANYCRADSNMIYGNTFLSNGYQATAASKAGGMVFEDFGRGDPTGNIVKNNIFFHDSIEGIKYSGVADLQTISNNWLSGNPLLTDTNVVNPFDYNAPNFHLQNNSDAVDSGAWLTTVSGTGSGTAFTVGDARYFCNGYGWGGDTIELQNRHGDLVVQSIAGNVITIDKRCSWTDGQGVALRYSRVAPDIGAKELTYKHESAMFVILDTAFNDTSAICSLTVWKSKLYLDTAATPAGTWGKCDSMTGYHGTVDTLNGRKNKYPRVWGTTIK
jgi:hypothetical protein